MKQGLNLMLRAERSSFRHHTSTRRHQSETPMNKTILTAFVGALTLVVQPLVAQLASDGFTHALAPKYAAQEPSAPLWPTTSGPTPATFTATFLFPK
jgi:hypothetical protein